MKIKKNDTKDTSKKESKEKTKAKVEIIANVVELAPKRVVEKIDIERIELTKTLLETWNKVGIVIHGDKHDKYTLNNMYVILEGALKKMLLAHK